MDSASSELSVPEPAFPSEMSHKISRRSLSKPSAYTVDNMLCQARIQQPQWPEAFPFVQAGDGMAAAKSLAKLIQDSQQQVALQSISLVASGGSPKKAASLRRTKVLHREDKECPSGGSLPVRQVTVRGLINPLLLWRPHKWQCQINGRACVRPPNCYITTSIDLSEHQRW